MLRMFLIIILANVTKFQDGKSTHQAVSRSTISIERGYKHKFRVCLLY